MTDTELNQRIRIDGAEDSARKLNMLAGAAGRIASGFGAVASLGGAVGGLAGVWQVAETIRETDQLYQAISRVKAMTGLAAENAHAMFDMFELSGIEMGASETILLSLARLSERMGGALSGSAAQAQDLRQLMTRLGIAVKAGPEERLYQMANAAQKGKLGIQDLIKAFQIPRTQAAQMMEMLQGGAARLKAIKTDTLGAGDLITESALKQHKEMLQIRRELADAWGGLVGTLYKSLLPGVTVVLNQIAAGFKSIEPTVQTIGKVLSDHMNVVVGLAKTYLALMLAAKAANVFAPGPAMGIFERGKHVVGGVNRMMAGRAAAAGSMDYFAARAAGAGAGPGGAVNMFASAGGPLIRIMSTVVGRLGIIGAVIMVVIAAFELLRRNVFGIRDAFVNVFSSVFTSVKNTVMMLIGILGKLFDAIKPLLMIIAGALLAQLYIMAKSIELVAWAVEKAVMAIMGIVNAAIWALNQIPGVDIDYIDMNKKAAAKKVDAATRGAGAGPGTTVNQDFRGSKFEIQNNFPEGIDGGRVAVAIGDELAALGERRLDSGLRPVFSYR